MQPKTREKTKWKENQAELNASNCLDSTPPTIKSELNERFENLDENK